MNPYETPKATPFSQTEMNGPVPLQPDPGLVSHVRVVAILMAVQGILEVVMGLFYGVFCILFPTVMRQAFEESPAMQQPPGLSPDTFVWIMYATYGGMALVNLMAGALHAYAGYRNYKFKGRVLGIIALAGGMATLLGCYCLPTAIALGVYGLIVYLNEPVAHAFRMGEQGYPGDAILAAFSRYRTVANSEAGHTPPPPVM